MRNRRDPTRSQRWAKISRNVRFAPPQVCVGLSQKRHFSMFLDQQIYLPTSEKTRLRALLARRVFQNSLNRTGFQAPFVPSALPLSKP